MAPLLTFVEKSKNYDLSARAVRALGEFRDVSLRNRTRIVASLAKTVQKDMPGRPKRGQENQTTGDYRVGRTGSSVSRRWSALSPEIPRALNKLTGQNFLTVEDWIDVVRDNKGRLSALFDTKP